MEKRCTPRVGTVTIGIDEYRRMMDASVRIELAKEILAAGDRYMMDTGTLRKVLGVADAPEGAEEV